MGKYYKEEDLPIIFELYKERKTDEIFKQFPEMTKSALYSLCSRHGVKPDNYFWSQEDIDILIKNHGIISNKEIANLIDMRHSPSCIATKAKALGLTNDRYWTEEQINLLKEIYPTKPIDEVLRTMNKSIESVRHMAKKLKISSFYTNSTYYTDNQKQFIAENFKKMSDEEIAKILNKSLAGVQEQRRKLGLYYIDKSITNYPSFSKFFRKNTSAWKMKSMEKCDYKCIFTGSKDFAIHHLYGFNLIVAEVMDILRSQNKLWSNDVNEYNSDELAYFVEVFNFIHDKYPLGVCIRKDIHDLFHKIYNSGNNNEEQWNEFVNNLNNGVYSNEIIL